MPKPMPRHIKFNVVSENVLRCRSDVLALKFARALFGADLAVAERLFDDAANPTKLLPELDEFKIYDSNGRIGCRKVLFLGVKYLTEFRYGEIRDFGRKVLTVLAGVAPSTRTLCITIHGPGYGLDEAEAFRAELAGLVDAVKSGDFPQELDEITFAERNVARAERLATLLFQIMPEGKLAIDEQEGFPDLSGTTQERLRSAGYASESKPNVFVAMPFAEEMDDVFHYGIQGAVNAAGLLCERADMASFTGDIMDWVKKRIGSASLVIADLSTANPNVYLEVGYAWGCGKPTVLLAGDATDLKFDVRGQRCLIYKKIKDLELALRNELEKLFAHHEI
jgi:hypothetical protein